MICLLMFCSDGMSTNEQLLKHWTQLWKYVNNAFLSLICERSIDPRTNRAEISRKQLPHAREEHARPGSSRWLHGRQRLANAEVTSTPRSARLGVVDFLSSPREANTPATDSINALQAAADRLAKIGKYWNVVVRERRREIIIFLLHTSSPIVS